MARKDCEGCGDAVRIAGGIANLWQFGGDETGGLVMEFTDGSEHFLCYSCIDGLPEDPVAEDVDALPE